VDRLAARLAHALLKVLLRLGQDVKRQDVLGLERRLDKDGAALVCEEQASRVHAGNVRLDGRHSFLNPCTRKKKMKSLRGGFFNKHDCKNFK
jgi:hypothetical protein